MKTKTAKGPDGITAMTVGGFKSITEPARIEIRPLTILAGANSSGKSSMMQPLLLLKQTLEADNDPGPLLLDGPNVRFTSVDQVLSKGTKGVPTNSFQIEIEAGGSSVNLKFAKKGSKRGVEVRQTVVSHGVESMVMRPGMKHEEIYLAIPSSYKTEGGIVRDGGFDFNWKVVQNRFFLSFLYGDGSFRFQLSWPEQIIEPHLTRLIHLPGLRGNPERAYPAYDDIQNFPGTFERYMAGTIADWQMLRDARLYQLSNWLEMMGLTWKVEAKYLSDTLIELRVGRSPKKTKTSSKDMVNLADVGLGVSQVLPVLVALLAAEPGQMVYLEQPEIHLHPRAKMALAQILVEAVKRGVRIVAETHSSLLLRGIQTLVARGDLDPEMIKLHWFQRDPDNGMTTVSSADLDENDVSGSCPKDFDQMILETEE
ncbi:MAG: AAA family ATPase [Deltaproteobacteria bacterium]|nr:AAA family ATPase [Deltaproteobacteria bacterium]